MEPDPKHRQRERYRRMMAKEELRQDNEREHAEARKARRQRKKQERRKPRERIENEAATGTRLGRTEPIAIVRAAHRAATVFGVDRTRVEIELDGARGFARRHPRLPAIVAGDVVEISTASDGVHRAERLVPRRTLLCREDPARPGCAKPIAANLDLGLITIPADRPRWGLVDRIADALATGGVDAAVVVTKLDLAAEDEIEGQLAALRARGLASFAVSIVDGRGVAALRKAVAGRSCAFLGHSGAGKSSLANALDPDHQRRTADVRASDRKGRHTTSRATLSILADGTRILDTPGIRAFGVVD